MAELNKVYINDVVISIPFSDCDAQRDIVSELETKRRNGYTIKRIEVDDLSKCVIYQIPNEYFN